LAAEIGAVSADHLISISEEGIRALARSETAATLLPAVSFFLMLDKRAPARSLLDAGAAVAVASDFNPGSSHISSMLFVLQLGVFLLRISVEEAINAVTANAAYALRRHESIGSLEVGKKMDLLMEAQAARPLGRSCRQRVEIEAKAESPLLFPQDARRPEKHIGSFRKIIVPRQGFEHDLRADPPGSPRVIPIFRRAMGLIFGALPLPSRFLSYRDT
jgi:hypothetical protein